jgi:hypothetical protein
MSENYCFKIIHCPKAKHVNVMHLIKILLEKQIIPLMFQDQWNLFCEWYLQLGH